MKQDFYLSIVMGPRLLLLHSGSDLLHVFGFLHLLGRVALLPSFLLRMMSAQGKSDRKANIEALRMMEDVLNGNGVKSGKT